MDTIYLTVEQIATLYRLSKTSQIGMQLRSNASDQSPVAAHSVLKDGGEGFAHILPNGTGAKLRPNGRPTWER